MVEAAGSVQPERNFPIQNTRLSAVEHLIIGGSSVVDGKWVNTSTVVKELKETGTLPDSYFIPEGILLEEDSVETVTQERGTKVLKGPFAVFGGASQAQIIDIGSSLILKLPTEPVTFDSAKWELDVLKGEYQASGLEWEYQRAQLLQGLELKDEQATLYRKVETDEGFFLTMNRGEGDEV